MIVTLFTDLEREIDEFVFSSKQSAANTVWIRRQFTDRPANETAENEKDEASIDDEYARGRLVSLCDTLVDRLDSKNRITHKVGYAINFCVHHKKSTRDENSCSFSIML